MYDIVEKNRVWPTSPLGRLALLSNSPCPIISLVVAFGSAYHENLGVTGIEPPVEDTRLQTILVRHENSPGANLGLWYCSTGT
jgi:hypothetical protein